MPSYATELAQLLKGVQRPGDFCAVGTCEIFAPRLEVEGIGPIALPLLPTQAEQLTAVAKRAPLSAAASKHWSIPTCDGLGRSMRVRSESMARAGREVWRALSSVLQTVSV